MPVDTFVNPEIIMGYKSPDLSGLDPSRMMANVLAYKQAQTQQQANALALQEAKQKTADQALLQEAYNQADPVNYLRGLGRLDIANAYAAQQQEQEGKKLDIENKRLQQQQFQSAIDKAGRENVTEALGTVRDMYAGVLARHADNLNSEDALKDYLEVSRTAHNNPFLGEALKTTGASLANTFTKGQTALESGTLGNLIQTSAMSADQLREAVKPKTATTPIGKLEEDYAAAVKRGDKVAAASIKKAIYVESGGMTEYQRQQLALERQREERLAKAATGGGKTTVSQEQANYNVNRLLNAANQITSAMTAEEGVQKPGLKEAVVKGTFPALSGAVQSGQRQIVDAAQTDMLDALLYLSTGAAYNKEQLEGQKKSYLPSFLDKPETVAAKQQRLITLIQDAKTRAGNAWTPDMDKKMDLILSSFKAAGTQPAAGGSNIPTVTTQKQYDALPKGAQFYEDGKLYRKP